MTTVIKHWRVEKKEEKEKYMDSEKKKKLFQTPRFLNVKNMKSN